MAKTVYIETSIPSAYTTHRKDPASMFLRTRTRTWWETQAPKYELLTSAATLAELQAGHYPGQAEAIALPSSTAAWVCSLL